VNSGHTLFVRENASCSKILNVKGIFNTVKNFRENYVIRASASCSKLQNEKNISEFSAQSIFQGKRKLLKTPECKKYIQYSEHVQGKLCFQCKRMLLKNPEC